MPGSVKPEEVADRLAISDLVAAYAAAIDTKDWDLLRTLFTDEATVDYSSAGGPSGPAEELIGWLEAMLSAFSSTQHLVSNERVELDGDAATAAVQLINPMVSADGGVMVSGGRYEDRLVRTPAGWRFASRTFHMGYVKSLG